MAAGATGAGFLFLRSRVPGRGRRLYPDSNFAHSGVITGTALLGKIVIRNKGQKLAFNVHQGQFAGSDANALLSTYGREGWPLPS